VVRRVVRRRVVLRDLVRAELDRVAVLGAVLALLLRAVLALLRAAGRFFAVLALRAAGLRVADLRAALLRAAGFFARDADDVDDFARDVVALSSSSDHLPEITRCAASATASAINAPSLLALDITLVAACEAESAASSPASRIFRRAAGLALIAAAAAARPAPSISRLIAALAILSTVDVPDRDEDLRDPEDDLPPLDDFEERFFVLDFAIAEPPCDGGKTLQERNGSVTMPCECLCGANAARMADA
jgi:hypothetical protein